MFETCRVEGQNVYVTVFKSVEYSMFDFIKGLFGGNSSAAPKEGDKVTVSIFNPTAKIDQMMGDSSASVHSTETWSVGNEISEAACAEIYHSETKQIYAVVEGDEKKPVSKLLYDTMIQTAQQQYPGLM